MRQQAWYHDDCCHFGIHPPFLDFNFITENQRGLNTLKDILDDNQVGVISMVPTPSQIAARDKRKYERIMLHLPGQLFNPLNNTTVECKILNLSAGGAALQCDSAFLPGISLVLYIENFGRFEGKMLVHEGGQHVLEFSNKEIKRARLVKMLNSFLNEGMAGVMKARMRARTHPYVNNKIILENGKRETYDILDISLQGLSLRTRLRPPIGEIVDLGRIRARVIRHDIEGIAVEYVKETKGAE